MKRKKKATGIVKEIVWKSEGLTIYKDTKLNEHYLYHSGESVFNAKTFDEVYGFSIKYRGMKG